MAQFSNSANSDSPVTGLAGLLVPLQFLNRLRYAQIVDGPPNLQIFTTGCFGSREDDFFARLTNAQIDTFVDIRQRRGVRGAKYAFVNSSRLQEKLASLGIRYVHMKELAPTSAVREVQRRADDELGQKKRLRSELSPEFQDAYQAQVLEPLRQTGIVQQLPENARRIVLFCVENAPTACHRSLAAQWLADALATKPEELRHGTQ